MVSLPNRLTNQAKMQEMVMALHLESVYVKFKFGHK